MKRLLFVLASVSLLSLTNCGKESVEQAITAPTQFNLIFPENNTECNEGIILSDTSSNVTFRWETSANADSYTLHLIDTDDNSSQTFNSNSSELSIDLYRGKAYRWYVVSKKNGVTETSQSDTWSFYNAGLPDVNHAPFQAELISPPNNSNVSSCQIEFQWSSNDLDDDVTNHQLILDKTYPPSTIAGSTSEISLANTLQPNSTYYWQIITIDQAGNKSKSTIFTFNTDVALTGCGSTSTTSTTFTNLVQDGEMNDTGAWNYRQLWTNPENSVNHGFETGEYAFKSVDGVTHSNAILWQEISVDVGVEYSFNTNIRSGGTTNSWLEIYFGTTPIEGLSGDDYTSNGAQVFIKSFGDGENCGVNAFEGSIFTVAANGCPLPSDSLFDENGRVTFNASNLTSNGTLFIAIKAGNYDGNFGSGIFIDNVSLSAN